MNSAHDSYRLLHAKQTDVFNNKLNLILQKNIFLNITRHKILADKYNLTVLYHTVPNSTLATLLVGSQTNVIISSYSTANKVPPVIYNITTHRHQTTCCCQKLVFQIMIRLELFKC